MKFMSKVLSVMLAIAMCLSLLPAAVFAAEVKNTEKVPQTETVESEEKSEEETEEETEEKSEEETEEKSEVETEEETEEKSEEETEEKSEEETEEKSEEETEEKSEEETEEKSEEESEEETEEESEEETEEESEEETEEESEEETEEETEENSEGEPEAQADTTVEIPEGYEEKTISVVLNYKDADGKDLPQAQKNVLDMGAAYAYSYVIDGKTYTVDLDYPMVEIMPGVFAPASSYRELKIPVPADGSPITVTIKMENLSVDGLKWYSANGYDTQWKQTAVQEITLTLTNKGGDYVWVYNYYQEVEPEQEPVDREVDIVVAFTADMTKPSFNWDDISEDYALEYSYVDPRTGATVTQTLELTDAQRKELTRWDTTNLDKNGNATPIEGEVDHAFSWPLKLPVGVKGVYLSFNQSGYDIDGYRWNEVVGTVDRPNGNGEGIGKLYVSFDNNPVTAYIWNVYTVPSTDPDPDPNPLPIVTPPVTIPDDDVPLADLPEIEIDDEDVPLASAIGLNDVDHMAYIIGYDDDTVKPLGNITRAEVATIFFRLMTDVYRTIYWSTENDFSDVNAGDWYNNAISTCANAEMMDGYADGTFKPNQCITRAEFAMTVANFLDGEYTGEDVEDFSDTVGHEAAQAIRRCVEAGWIVRTADNTFRPDEFITRAEVMTIINRMLHRTPDADHMIPTMKTWIDNPQGTEYYEAVQEATNEHNYERDDDEIETWTGLLEVRDWKALEEEWADEMTED